MAGKGSKPRISDYKSYKENFQKINWKKRCTKFDIQDKVKK